MFAATRQALGPRMRTLLGALAHLAHATPSRLPKQRLHDSSRCAQAERLLKYRLSRVAEKVSRQGGIAGHEDDTRRVFTLALPNGCIQARPVQPWHLKVGEDGIVMMLVKPVERLETVAGGIDLVTLMSQNVGQQVTEDVFVVDHKDALLSHCLRAREQQGACQLEMPVSAGPPDYCGARNGQLLVGQR